MSKGILIAAILEKLEFRAKFIGLGLNTWTTGHQHDNSGYYEEEVEGALSPFSQDASIFFKMNM